MLLIHVSLFCMSFVRTCISNGWLVLFGQLDLWFWGFLCCFVVVTVSFSLFVGFSVVIWWDFLIYFCLFVWSVLLLFLLFNEGYSVFQNYFPSIYLQKTVHIHILDQSNFLQNFATKDSLFYFIPFQRNLILQNNTS